MCGEECQKRGKEHSADSEATRVPVAVQDHQHEARREHDLQGVNGKPAPYWLALCADHARDGILQPEMIGKPFTEA